MSKLDNLISSGSMSYVGPFVEGTNRFKPIFGDNVVRVLPDFQDEAFDPAVEAVIVFKAQGKDGKFYSVPVSTQELASSRPLAKAWTALMASAGGFGNLFRNKALREHFYKTYFFYVMARPILVNGAEVELLSKKNQPIVASFGYGLVTSLVGAAKEFELSGLKPFHPTKGHDFKFKYEKLGANKMFVKSSFLGFLPKESEIPNAEKVRQYLREKPLTSLFYRPSEEEERMIADRFLQGCYASLENAGEDDGEAAMPEAREVHEAPSSVKPRAPAVTVAENDDIPW